MQLELKKAVQKQLPLLQGYEEIVIFFDDDLPGRQAAEECASVLPPGKVKIARLQGDYKDASDALQANDTQAVCKAIWDAKPFRPDGIVDGKTLLDLVTTPSPAADHDYPFQGLQSKLHGIRYGELVTITAGSGIGKSSFCRELATNLLSKGERVGYLALEESNRRTALGLMSAHVGKSLHLREHTHEELTAAFDATMADWDLYLFDGFGSYDPDVIYNRIEYLAQGLDCKIIFLDHLSILLSGLDGDERRMIDTTMTKLRSLVERTGIALFLVSHLKRTSSDQNHEEEEHVLHLDSSEALQRLHSYLTHVLDSNAISRVEANSLIRLLESSRIDIQGKLASRVSLSYDLPTCKFHETQPEPEFNASNRLLNSNVLTLPPKLSERAQFKDQDVQMEREVNTIFDIETNGLLHDVTTIHCLAIHDLSTNETISYNDTGI